MLTPLYAAQEQARGEPVTIAADVYALGLLLYHLLTGQHPGIAARGDLVPTNQPWPLASRVVGDAARRGDDELQSAAAARSSTLTRLAEGLAGDLDNILAKALREDPAERYATVAALAEDLQRHLDGHPVRARPDSLAYRANRFVRRHRKGVALAGMALTIVVATAGLAEQQRRAAERERDGALQQRVATEAVAGFLEEQLGQMDETGGPRDPAARIDLAQRRAEQLFHDRPDVLVRLHDVFHNLNGALYRQEEMQRNAEAVDAIATQAEDPLVRAEALCGAEEAKLSNEESLARIDRGLALLPDGGAGGAIRAKCLFHRHSHLRDAARYAEALRDLDAADAANPPPLRRMSELSYLRARGIVMNEMGRPYEADLAYARVAEAMRAAGRGSSLRYVYDLDWRVLLHWRMGRPREALPFAEEAADLVRRTGRTARDHAVATALRALLLVELEQPDRARLLLESALLRERRLEPPFPRAWDLVAPALRLRGEPEKAIEVLKRDLAQNAGHGDATQDAIIRKALIEEYLQQHDAANALAMLDATEADAAVLTFRWETCWQRARAHNLAGNAVAAEEAARRAIDESERRSPPSQHSSLRGFGYLELARALSAQGRADSSRAAAARALEELDDALGAQHAATRAASALIRQ